MSAALALRAPAVPRAETLRLLAVALALAVPGAAWLTVLRQATGTVTVAQTPVLTGMVTLAVLVPLTTAAVLLAQRHGPSRRPVLAATVVLGGAVLAAACVGAVPVGTDVAAQLSGGGMSAAMGRPCDAACAAAERALVASTHLRAAGLVLVALVVTDVAALAWVTALVGGLPLSGRTRPISTTVAGAARRDLALALAGAAVVHALVVPPHLAEWPAAGVFFVVLALGQAAATVGVVGVRGRTVPLLVLVVTLVPVATWVWSRSVGLPFGPEPGAAEAVGLADAASTVLELLAAALALRELLLPGLWPTTVARSTDRAAGAAVLVAIAVAAILGATSLGAALWAGTRM